MKFLISGASGLVGKALIDFLTRNGNEVYTLVRKNSAKSNTEIPWDPETLKLDPNRISGFDCIINLSGENIASGLWTKPKKTRIFNSRILTTKLLAQAITLADIPPKVFLNASAIGIYAQSNGKSIDENSALGSSFLAEICQFWEAETIPISDMGIRTLFLRFGVILSTDGGALAKMLLPFKLGLGGKLGTGTQMMSWVSLTDVVSAIYYLAKDSSLSGPVNITSPNPVSNSDYTRILSKTLNRPAFFHLPKGILKLIFGEMAEEVFLKNLAVTPQKLTEVGFTFEDSNLSEFLKKELVN